MSGICVFGVAASPRPPLPFDFPEADSELVGGYHTEYSSMKFAMFFMSEYMAMATMAALITTLFLGGWDIPYYQEPPTFTGFLLSALMFLAKVSLLLFIFVWALDLPRSNIRPDADWMKVFLPGRLNCRVALLIAKGCYEVRIFNCESIMRHEEIGEIQIQTSEFRIQDRMKNNKEDSTANADRSHSSV